MNSTFDISIVTDDLLEGDEIFHLVIDSSSLPDAVTTGDQETNTVLILDDDREWLHNIIMVHRCFLNKNSLYRFIIFLNCLGLGTNFIYYAIVIK